MKTSLLCLALLPGAVLALDLSRSGTDVAFAERYAFATNRADVIATLQPESTAWFYYSVLNDQTEGRDASALLERWRQALKRWSSGDYQAGAYGQRAFFLREKLLDFDAANPNLTALRAALADCGIRYDPRERETPLAPNTYPSVLDPQRISFATFAKGDGREHLEDAFAFLPYLASEPFGSNRPALLNPDRTDILPDVPGILPAALAWLKADKDRNVFRAQRLFANMTLAQLATLAEELKGTPQDLYGNRSFATLVLKKMDKGADDDFLSDPAAEERLLRRRVAFTDKLQPSLGDLRRDAYRALLDFAYAHGRETAFKAEFLTYLDLLRGKREKVSVDGQNAELLAGCLYAFRRAGSDLSEFRSLVASDALDHARVTTDLFLGRPVSEAAAKTLTESEFKMLRDLVDLTWSRANPKLFAAADAVTLALDVKNVKRLRLSIYALDPFEACRALDGEVKSDIDLDGAVPTVSRTYDYASYPALVRHTETFDLPELAAPGLYVVECSGAGRVSRALVRKGRLRATERRDGAGHVFTALDEQGHVVKGTKLRLGETVFTADEAGEIAVPFAADRKSAGRKTVVIGDGHLATTLAFEHVTETLFLDLAAVVPPETLVAGRRATALLRPALTVSGVPAPLELLKGATLTLTFTDLDGRKRMETVADFTLADDAETPVTFTVPERLGHVAFRLEGTVRAAVTGKEEHLVASTERLFNGVAHTDNIAQPFLRRTDRGYRLELRGRNGEPLASRALTVHFKHRAFVPRVVEKMQTDAEGALDLGELRDIAEVLCAVPDGLTETWRLTDTKLPLPDVLTAAEGEPIELPLRSLLAGDWPGADELAARVSLLGVNDAGEIVTDALPQCVYSNGVLRIEGLAAGDYTLRLRDRNETCKIFVARTAEGVGEGGVLASAARSLTDVGSPSLLSIASAACDTNGTLRVRLAASSPDARVHVFAARTSPSTSEGKPPAESLWDALVRGRARHSVTAVTFGTRGTDYVSGRELGEKLQYVLERRQEPHRVGNMLGRPSLLLNPWSLSETETKDVKLGDGENWAAAEDIPTDEIEALTRSGCGAGNAAVPLGGFLCRDFLPEAETVIANARPDADGWVTVDLTQAAEAALRAQDVTVVATDGRRLDAVSLYGAAVPFVPRDLRHNRTRRPASAAQARTLATAAELLPVLRSLGLEKRSDRDFSFVAAWDGKTDAEKRALYDDYASHELDFFVHEKDPAFFASVVKPHLANKRRKDFVDRWLLGEDVSSYAAPGALANLNAFEQCLLARRVPAVAQQIARRFADWCAAHPVPAQEVDAAYDVVLTEGSAETDFLQSVSEASADLKESRRVAREAMVRSVAANWSSQMEPCAPEAPIEVVNSPIKMKAMTGSRTPGAVGAARLSRAVAERRQSRQLYRPPERTREWVETDYYHQRPGDTTKDRIGINAFWRDYAAAIAAGKTETFASENVMFALENETAGVLALAVTKVPVVFTRPAPPVTGTLAVTHRYGDPSSVRSDGSRGAEVRDEFVKGHVYTLVTAVSNPTDASHRETLPVEIPEGALPLATGRAFAQVTFDVAPYSVEPHEVTFYFPEAGGAVTLDSGAKLPVVATPTRTDTTSWDYVSQNGTKGEVLDFLKTQNLESPSVDLGKIAWRMKDGAYARKVWAVLDARGAYNRELWLAGLSWREAFDAARVREVLAREENQRRLAKTLGPVFVSPLVTIEPEATDLFEHKEYWPLINARAHAVAGASRLANEQLAAQYRAFLDVLAAKRTLTAEDRLLTCVYLIAQDRLEEAKAQLAQVAPAEPEEKMQLAYLRAYLAFCDGDAEKGRALAAPYVKYPVEHWAKRFREVIAQADEAEGKGASATDAEAAKAPTLALAAQPGAVVVTAANLAEATLKAYPTDIEITFSKDPFGTKAKGSDTVRALKPAWCETVKLDGSGETVVELPENLAARTLVLVASGAEGRAEARLEMTPRVLDVQVTREYRQLRVRDAKGKPLPGAYVKVYAKDASGRAMKFHKDGYTDLRGAFDYAAVSTDTDFKPAEYAILVLHDTAGSKILRVTADK